VEVDGRATRADGHTAVCSGPGKREPCPFDRVSARKSDRAENWFRRHARFPHAVSVRSKRLNNGKTGAE